jgi:hypothetical protein
VLLRRSPWFSAGRSSPKELSASIRLFVGDTGVIEMSTGELRPGFVGKEARCGVRPGAVRGVPTPSRETWAFFGVMGTKSTSLRSMRRFWGILRGVQGDETGEGDREEVDASGTGGKGVAMRGAS